MSFRTRKAELSYKKFRKANPVADCNFCAFHADDRQTVREAEYFWIAKNIFAYSLWEGLDVQEHLMVVPKKHRDSLHHFTPAELREYSELVAEYDERGYSTYTRSSLNVSKSVAHQHTHLLKLGQRHTKATFYLQKPYILWYR